MAKTKKIYACQQCDAQSPKWTGQCGECGAWNSLIESLPQAVEAETTGRFANYAGEQSASVTRLIDVPQAEQIRIPTTITELDHVLGGGLVPGAVTLIGGDPGIGKSTLLLQTLCQLSTDLSALYVTGEESLQQVSMRAQRLELPQAHLNLLAETQTERMIQCAQQLKPSLMVIDSVQTIHTQQLQSAPGSMGQVRESAAQLVRFAKQTNTALFLVGHVTKEGALAGPRVLEHMVDSVLYFEGQTDSRYRVIRAIKNRFGAVNELGVFAMTDKGLRGVNNPSAIFLSRSDTPVPGSVVMCTWEGSRPMLVEVQALVDESHLGNPRRVCVGLDQQRLSMLLAVLHRHGGIASYDQDVFLNVVGGMRVSETAADLATLLAVQSSLRNCVFPQELMVFGEVGLAGEIRPVQSGQERLKEALKHGFKRAIVPAANAPKDPLPGVTVHPVKHISEALSLL